MAGMSQYDEEIADRICGEILEGKSLVTICKQDGFPVRSTVFKWLSENRAFSDKYARAKELQMEAMSEEILEIADDGSNDTYETEDGDERVNTDVINRSRLRVDTRKWLMSKLAPKKYGDKLAVGGAEDLPPIQAAVMVEFVKPKSQE